MSDEEESMLYDTLSNMIQASKELSDQDNPEVAIMLPDGETLEIHDTHWDHDNNVIFIRTT